MLLQYSSALEKGKRLIKAGCIFSEFGTRRRRNAKVQDVVVSALKAASQESVGPVAGTAYFAGTSNVYLAKKYDLSPIGTVAHEWTMAISGIEEEGGDLLHANKNALEKWLEAYPDEFLIALCDTYGTPAFLADFNEELAAKYLGVRQDSGDPELFVDRVVGRYRELGIDPAAKSLIFSDSLNVDKAIKLQRYVDSKKGGGIVAKVHIFYLNRMRSMGSELT
jgi:nicotinate phosphoribosyltransferase